MKETGARRGGSSQGVSQRHRAAPYNSQPSQREDEDAIATQALLSDEETNKLCAEVMRYMLFKNFQQPGVPVRRDELTQLITKNYKQRYLPSHVISMAQRRLKTTFGFEMRELVRLRSSMKSSRANAAPQADVKQYVLRTTIPEDFLKEYVETLETAAFNSLTLVVIGIIKYSGERVTEEVLWQNLGRLGIREDDVDHPNFGNVKNALDTIAKQRYIQKEKLTTAEGDGFVYELAERAIDSPNMEGVESFMAKIVTRDHGRGS